MISSLIIASILLIAGSYYCATSESSGSNKLEKDQSVAAKGETLANGQSDAKKVDTMDSSGASVSVTSAMLPNDSSNFKEPDSVQNAVNPINSHSDQGEVLTSGSGSDEDNDDENSSSIWREIDPKFMKNVIKRRYSFDQYDSKSGITKNDFI